MVVPDLQSYLAFMSLVTQVVCAVIRNERGEYLATQRGSGSFEGLWEFPGGKVEPGESIEEATSRELLEELSITTTTSGVMLINKVELHEKALELVFVATQIIEGDIQLNEHRACKWLLPSEMGDLEWLPGDLPMVEFLSKS
tara:strand:+ start:194 stop:619 length:426 start_codon:yes stop_codon:yes gene_type:complete